MRQSGQACSVDVELQQHEGREQHQQRVEQVKCLLQSLESGEAFAGNCWGYRERDKGSCSDSAGSAKTFAGWLSDRQAGPAGGVEAEKGGLGQHDLQIFSSGDSSTASDAGDSRGYTNLSLLYSSDADDSDGSGDGGGCSASISGDGGSSDVNASDGDGDRREGGDSSGSDDGSGSDGGCGNGSGSSGSSDGTGGFTVGQHGGNLAKGTVGFMGSGPQGSRSCSCSCSGGSSDTEVYAPVSGHSLCS